MARDPAAPADPGSTQDTSVDPTQTLPNRGQPQGVHSDLDGGDYDYWLRDGVTPYRTRGPAEADVFGTSSDGWLMQHAVDRDKLWPSSPDEIAGMIGGRQRLTEPTKGASPVESGPDQDFSGSWQLDEKIEPTQSPDYIAEADSEADVPQPPPSRQGEQDDVSDLPQGGMNEQQIRDAGLRIDVPFESPLPVGLKYKDTGQQAWTPPPGFRQGLPPLENGGPEDGGSSGETGGSGS